MNGHSFTVVDAFTDEPFRGNPAAVMVLERFFADDQLARIAAEHAYAETAFLVPLGGTDYELRWFTPTVEVSLCGHGTLAAAHALFTEHGVEGIEARFRTRSGTLAVRRENGLYRLDLPADDPCEVPVDPAVPEALGAEVTAMLRGRFLLAVLESERAVRSLRPNLALVEALDADEIVATARGEATDIVSRMFGPKIGIPEDPFTGAAHTALVPYWSRLLGKTRLSAHQASARGGDALCELSGGRVFLFGNARTTMRGQMFF